MVVGLAHLEHACLVQRGVGGRPLRVGLALLHGVDAGSIAVDGHRHAVGLLLGAGHLHLVVLLLEGHLGGLAQCEDDGYDGGGAEERHQTLAERDGASLHNLLLALLLNHGEDTLVEVAAQPILLLLYVLVGEQRAQRLQFSRNVGLAEEGSENLLFLEGGLGGPVALKQLVDVFVVHLFVVSN